MQYKTISLEEIDKPDWKQWLPVYGIYQLVSDGFKRKPTIIDNRRGETIFLGSAIYQATSLIALTYGVSFGLGAIIENFSF
jgi:hypothetical protein